MKASAEVTSLARPFMRALREDMEEKGADVLAEWTGSGYLLVIAKGWKAVELDAYMRRNRIAEPRGRKRQSEQDIA